MGWGLKGKRFGQFALAAMLASQASYVAAEVLVLRSGGPSASRYRAGQKLPDSAVFTLRPGDSVVVLAGGTTRTFRGPGSFSASGPARAGQLASASVRRTTGATRAVGAIAAVARPDNVWHVDVTTSGRACVSAGQAPILWRPDASRELTLTISPQNGAAAQTIVWEKDQTTLAWPASLPVSDGASYQFDWEGARAPSRVTTQVVEQMPATDVEALATALVDKSCLNQLDVFIAKNAFTEERNVVSGGGGAAQ